MQKMLCDAFLFKNVICVINSRMCLALECLTVFLLSLFRREEENPQRDTNGSLYTSREFSFSETEREGGMILGHFSLFGRSLVMCVYVCVRVCVFYGFTEVAQCPNEKEL